MKVKEIISLKGCYSAADVGEKGIPEASVNEVAMEMCQNIFNRHLDKVKSHAKKEFLKQSKALCNKFIILKR